MKFAKVVVDLKNNQLDTSYDYIIPEALEDFIDVGSRVLVSFGFQEIMGYVIGISDDSIYAKNAKSIIDCLDYDQELSKEQIELALYISKLMHVKLIAVLQLMIPSFLKGQSRKYLVVKEYNKLHPELALLFKGKDRLPVNDSIKKVFDLVKSEIKKGNITLDYNYYYYGRSKKIIEYSINEAVKGFKSSKREAIYNYVSYHKGCVIDDIMKFVNCSFSLIKDMVKDGDLLTREVPVISDEVNELKNECNYKFSFDDEATIQNYFLSENKKFLLHSNDENFKAAFYLRIVEECKKRGEQVLITCPTIILQEEILMYLRKNLSGYKIYGMTNKNTNSEKYDCYMNVKYNACDCVVTTHNGIFLPFANLGAIIVVDEENNNYNNENYPYYRACDVLDYRSEYHNAKIMYTSSSPSLYNYKRAEDGILKHLTKINNYKNIRRVINMKDAILNGENEVISNYLKARMKDRLDKGEQIMLFVSSKAYSSMLVCDACGKILKCPQCRMTLNYYKEKNVLRCNYCDYKNENLSSVTHCSCGGTYRPFGFGQEKVYEVISEMFPDKRILNVNADLMSKRDDYNEALIAIEENKVDIIIGTNILTKSINADNITLVGFVNFDNYLNNSSHRANEYSYNFISKLSNKEEVIIQAYNTDSWILKEAIANDYDTYYEKEINSRKELGYEPFNEVNRITVTGDFKQRYAYVKYLRKVFMGYFRPGDGNTYNILGPIYDYRTQGVKVIVKHNDFNKMCEILDKTSEVFSKEKIYVNFERYPKYM